MFNKLKTKQFLFFLFYIWIIIIKAKIVIKKSDAHNTCIRFLFEMKYLHEYIVESTANNLFKNSPCLNMAATMG